MINLNFDRFDFASAVEGFANGSHLRQHVWREHVFRSIQQMTDDEMDFLWFIFRRNLWDCYFREREGMIVCELAVMTICMPSQRCIEATVTMSRSSILKRKI